MLERDQLKLQDPLGSFGLLPLQNRKVRDNQMRGYLLEEFDRSCANHFFMWFHAMNSNSPNACRG